MLKEETGMSKLSFNLFLIVSVDSAPPVSVRTFCKAIAFFAYTLTLKLKGDFREWVGVTVLSCSVMPVLVIVIHDH